MQSTIKTFCAKDIVKTPKATKDIREATPIRREARILKASMAIECSNDLKKSNAILETAKAQLDEQRSLISKQIDHQR
jgi:hypothetical protein